MEASTTTVVDLDFIGKHLNKAAPQQFQRMSCPFTILRGVKICGRDAGAEVARGGGRGGGRSEVELSMGGERWVCPADGALGARLKKETCLPVTFLRMFNPLIGEYPFVWSPRKDCAKSRI